MFDKNFMEQQKKLLASLEAVNKNKAMDLQQLQKDIGAPSLESLEKLLDHINKEFQGLEADNPLYKMIVVLSHKMAAVLDEPNETILALYEKYGVLPPKFKE